MSEPHRGVTFTHKHFLEPADRARKATMKITRVTKLKVFYNYAETPDNVGRWQMPREYWVETYGGES